MFVHCHPVLASPVLCCLQSLFRKSSRRWAACDGPGLKPHVQLRISLPLPLPRRQSCAVNGGEIPPLPFYLLVAGLTFWFEIRIPQIVSHCHPPSHWSDSVTRLRLSISVCGINIYYCLVKFPLPQSVWIWYCKLYVSLRMGINGRLIFHQFINTSNVGPFNILMPSSQNDKW